MENGYVVKKVGTRDRKRWLARAGSKHSYTASLMKARMFPSLEAARAECCGNEVAIKFIKN